MPSNVIPLLQPSCTQAEINAVVSVLKSGWWGTGKVVEQFEKEMAELYGYRYCVTTNSGTAALHLSMLVLDVGPGDEVIVPPLTFVSTGLAPIYVGATPVLADIDPKTLCIDWDCAEAKITPRTKAIIAVDYAGYPAGRRDLGIPVIQDAAHSCGGTPGYGDMICLSFHPVKNLATGDGGAVLTNNRHYAERMRALRWCGINKSTWERSQDRYGWDYDIEEVGFKYHWNDIQAAIGLAQFHRLGGLNAARRCIAKEYDLALRGYLDLLLPPNHRQHTWHLYPIRVPAHIRNELVTKMLDKGVSAGVHYKPLNHYSMFDGETPVAEEVWQRLISMPMFYDLYRNPELFDTVIDTFTESLEELV